ncbi:MAG: coenzyme F420-dependent oxidoreductase, partial [Frankiales bacterium]|nr:coenzyme F420-dependent oxidoreductase [Frankiales bacterium]
ARAADLLPGVPVLPVDDVLRRATLVLLTVPDDALPDLVAGLAAAGAVQRGQLLAHTSGRHGLAVLEPAVRQGALPLALHPVLPFSGTRVDLERLHGTAFGVTAPEPLRPVAEVLVVEMGGEPVWLTEEQRPLWHAALAHAANHLTTLVASSADLLRRAGVEHPGQVLGPLLGAALDGSLRSGDAALTGPVARGDAGTVKAHLDVLAAVAPEVLPSYLAMARLTADRALASGRLDPERAWALLEVLGSVPR